MAKVILLFSLVIFGAKRIVGEQLEELSSFRPAQGEEGDYCVLRTGETGVCRRSESCDWRQPRVHHRRGKNITHCRSRATEHIVCCPPANLSSAEFATKACRSIRRMIPEEEFHCAGCGASELPFIAALGRRYEKAFTWFCGSSLITPRYLLTAAHCLINIKTPVIARMGTSNLLENKEENYWIQDRDVMTFIRHPRYRRISKKNDIALVLVDHPFIFSETVASVCLSTSQEDMDETEEMYAAGWGMTGSRHESPDQLFGTHLTTVPINKCKKMYELIGEANLFLKKTIYDTQYCAIGEQISERSFSDLCPGDSGGPLISEVSSRRGRTVFLKYYQLGIISHGINCGGDLPGVYVRVGSYLDWIASVVGTLED